MSFLFLQQFIFLYGSMVTFNITTPSLINSYVPLFNPSMPEPINQGFMFDENNSIILNSSEFINRGKDRSSKVLKRTTLIPNEEKKEVAMEAFSNNIVNLECIDEAFFDNLTKQIFTKIYNTKVFAEALNTNSLDGNFQKWLDVFKSYLKYKSRNGRDPTFDSKNPCCLIFDLAGSRLNRAMYLLSNKNVYFLDANKSKEFAEMLVDSIQISVYKNKDEKIIASDVCNQKSIEYFEYSVARFLHNKKFKDCNVGNLIEKYINNIGMINNDWIDEIETKEQEIKKLEILNSEYKDRFNKLKEKKELLKNNITKNTEIITNLKGKLEFLTYYQEKISNFLSFVENIYKKLLNNEKVENETIQDVLENDILEVNLDKFDKENTTLNSFTNETTINVSTEEGNEF